MNFDLSEDDAMLKALGERFVLDRYDGDARRAYVAAPSGFSSENWALLGNLGLIAALGEADGTGLDASAIATLFEAMGRGLVAEPLIENVLLPVRLFASSAQPDLRTDWLESLLEGGRRIALAHAEPKSRPGRLWIEARAEPVDGGWQITGTKSCVPAGHSASGFIVTARTSGQADQSDGVVLLFVPADAPGLAVSNWRMADGSTAASVEFDQVFVPEANRLDCGLAVLDQAQTLANLARGAEALGIMERLFADTLAYLRTREQFGTRIGSFQAIQHRMATQYSVIEQSRALLNLALVSHGTPDFAQAVSGLRAYLGSASIFLGHEMIQFHGGMGVTDELAIGQGHKRLLVLSRWPDDPESALDRFAGIAA